MLKKTIIVVAIISLCAFPTALAFESYTAKKQALAKEQEKQTENPTAPVSAMESQNEATPFELIIMEPSYELKLYEPPVGCYLGANIMTNNKVDYDIETFEKAVGSQHAIYANQMYIDDPFPSQWVLSCIANIKTPYVTISPKNMENPPNVKEIEKLAKSFGEYYVPMFVGFAPVDLSVSPEDYVEHYRVTREIFKKHATNVAFVWNVNLEDSYDCVNYYPGDELVDWVGLNIEESLAPNETYNDDVFKAIDNFYYRFQHDKPMMISSLKVSHLNSSDFIYQTTPAATEIQRIYEKIIKEYPRIKGIIYDDCNEIATDTKEKAKDDFSITDEEEILYTYREATSNPNFLRELEVYPSGDSDVEEFKSPFRAYEIEGKYYISEQSIENDLKIMGVKSFGEAKKIDNTNYYDVQMLVDAGLGTTSVDEEKKQITFTKDSS